MPQGLLHPSLAAFRPVQLHAASFTPATHMSHLVLPRPPTVQRVSDNYSWPFSLTVDAATSGVVVKHTLKLHWLSHVDAAITAVAVAGRKSLSSYLLS